MRHCHIAYNLYVCEAATYLNTIYFFVPYLSKRLNYVNHARRLADGDWTGADSDGEEDMEKEDEEKQKQDASAEEEGMEIERRKLPRHYANQVSAGHVLFFFICEGSHASLILDIDR